ncbi:MAG: hypothetical protein IID18_00355 [Nitrospinae bacterium]|nr:hypothetical protein [Nitrospinota bacterium]
MIQRLLNLVKLACALMTRGNWKLIRHSRNQLTDFIFCRSGLNRKSPANALYYWYDLLKGPEMLIWRLETFGFLFIPEAGPETRKRLNRNL